MDSSLSSSKDVEKGAWSPAYLIEQQPVVRRGIRGYGARFFNWWYRVTVPASSKEQTSLRMRELFRRAKLNSIVLLLLLTFVVVFMVVTFPYKNTVFLVMLLLSGSLSFLALALNARRQVLIASFMTISITIVVPVAFPLVTTLNTTDVLILGFLCIPELLAATLLSPGSVFFLAAINSAISISILTLMGVPNVIVQSGTSISELMFCLILFYVSVAIVVYILTHTTGLAVLRADRAEVVASLEHAMAEREHVIAQQKRDLDLGIQYILQTHLQVANGDYGSRVPFLKANVLWPIAGSLNTILARLQRLQKLADELEQTKQEATRLAAALHAARMGQQPLQFQRTGTAIDLISLELSTDVHSIGQEQQMKVREYHESD